MMLKLWKLFSILWSLRNQENRKSFIIMLRGYFRSIAYRSQILAAHPDKPYKDVTLHSGVNPKILLVVHEFSRTGVPHAVLYLARALFSLHGVRPAILSPNDGSMREAFEQEGFPTIVAPSFFSSRDCTPEACNYVASFESIIVTSLAAFDFIRNFRGICKSLTWWIHETDVSFSAVANTTADLPYFFAACESIWLGSPLCFPLALRYAPPEKLHLLLYGCSDEALPHHPHESGKIVFSIFGSVERRKGQDVFLDAIELLSEDLRRNAIFRIVGSPLPHESSRYFKKIRTRAARIPEVECIENVPSGRLVEVYADTNVFVSASRDDPMPIVITQGLIFSKVCLCSSAIGHAQFIKNRKNGLIFSNESAEELSANMAWLIRNPTELATLGKGGRELYEEYFLESVFVNNLAKLNRDVQIGH